MENAGCVTFREDYVFRSQGHRRRVRAARRDDPARAGAHVVRRPGHHALVGRPVAERVVRRVRVGARARPQATRWTDAWTTFANVEKTWAYRQDQLPRPTRSPPTSPTCRPSRSTSTASPTPRAPACSSSWWRTSGSTRSCAALRAYFAGTRTATPRSPTCSRALEEASGRDLSSWSAQWLETAGINTLRAGVRARRPTGAYALVRDRAGGPPSPAPDAARPTGSAIGLLRRSTDGKLVRASGSSWTSAGERTEVPELVGVAAAGRAAGQRRRPDLRASSGWTSARMATVVERIADFDDSLPRALCWARGLGHDPRRRAGRPRLRGAGAAPASRGETDIGVVQSHPGAGAARARALRRPGLGAGRLGAAGRRCAERALRAAAPGSDLQLAWARTLRGRRPHAGARRGRARAARRHRAVPRAWPSTPSCAGRCCTRWSRSAPPAEPRSRPSWSATRPPPGSGTRRPRARCGRPRRPRPRRGGWRPTDDELPNAIVRGGHRRLLAPGAARADRAVRAAVLRR